MAAIWGSCKQYNSSAILEVSNLMWAGLQRKPMASLSADDH